MRLRIRVINILRLKSIAGDIHLSCHSRERVKAGTHTWNKRRKRKKRLIRVTNRINVLNSTGVVNGLKCLRHGVLTEEHIGED